MVILSSDCGWISNETVNFLANIVSIIKIAVPLLIIIMGSVDFVKAVVSQKEDQIKKSQIDFIQKLIAGVAVFFVFTFASWIMQIIANADKENSLNTENAMRCVALMLNGGYQADKIQKYTTTTTTTAMEYDEQADYQYCVDLCKAQANGNQTAYDACYNNSCKAIYESLYSTAVDKADQESYWEDASKYNDGYNDLTIEGHVCDNQSNAKGESLFAKVDEENMPISDLYTTLCKLYIQSELKKGDVIKYNTTDKTFSTFDEIDYNSCQVRCARNLNNTFTKNGIDNDLVNTLIGNGVWSADDNNRFKNQYNRAVYWQINTFYCRNICADVSHYINGE